MRKRLAPPHLNSLSRSLNSGLTAHVDPPGAALAPWAPWADVAPRRGMGARGRGAAGALRSNKSICEGRGRYGAEKGEYR